eukprot:6183542-Pleurochrysis_carterae.AAC.1
MRAMATERIGGTAAVILIPSFKQTSGCADREDGSCRTSQGLLGRDAAAPLASTLSPQLSLPPSLAGAISGLKSQSQPRLRRSARAARRHCVGIRIQFHHRKPWTGTALYDYCKEVLACRAGPGVLYPLWTSSPPDPVSAYKPTVTHSEWLSLPLSLWPNLDPLFPSASCVVSVVLCFSTRLLPLPPGSCLLVLLIYYYCTYSYLEPPVSLFALSLSKFCYVSATTTVTSAYILERGANYYYYYTYSTHIWKKPRTHRMTTVQYTTRGRRPSRI